jgi:hypothetical protein
MVNTAKIIFFNISELLCAYSLFPEIFVILTNFSLTYEFFLVGGRMLLMEK